MRVVSKFVINQGVTLTVKLEVNQEAGLSQQQIDEVRLALRELGLVDEVTIT
jgi:anti-sigma regulatory factor (Ser/Thr protein kinase)